MNCRAARNFANRAAAAPPRTAPGRAEARRDVRGGRAPCLQAADGYEPAGSFEPSPDDGTSPEMIGISLVEKSFAQSDCASSDSGSL